MWWLTAAGLIALDTGGYLEVRTQVASGVEGDPLGVTERFRPSLEAQPWERVEIHATLEAALSQGRDDSQVAWDLVNEAVGDLLAVAKCSLPEPAPRVETMDDVLSVERLFVDLYLPAVDVRVGRQALNWGSALVLNPTDLFGEVLLAEPWRERAGVDAARATVPIGESHQVVGVAAVGRDLDEGRFGLRPTVSLWETDVSGVGVMDTEGEAFLGVDLRGQVEVGWWLEGGVHMLEEATPEASVGLDYSLPVDSRLFFALQYTYDGTGVAPGDYSLASRGMVVDEPECSDASLNLDLGLPEKAEPRFTLGRHYGLATTRFYPGDLWAVQAMALVNLEDFSALVVPSVSWTPGQRLSLHGGAQVMVGEGEFAPGPELTTLTIGEEGSPVEIDFDGIVPNVVGFLYARVAL
jgi:hypothetical protein